VSIPEAVAVTEEVRVVQGVLPDPDEHAAIQVVNPPSKEYTRKEGVTLDSTQAAIALNYYEDGRREVHANPTGVSNVAENKRERVDRWKWRKKRSHELVREHLGIIANRMQNWCDQKVTVHYFDEGDEVYVLNLRLYPNKCPNGSDATVTWESSKRKYDVTYIVRCDDWRSKERILHVEKLKLRRKRSEANPGVCPD